MKYQYEFAICAIFKNESLIIKQWLEHHIRFGCEHFYLINNHSSDQWLPILGPYIDSGMVDLAIEHRYYRQWFAYNEYFLEDICKQARWIAVIDIDEFLYPRGGHTDMQQVLGEYDHADALAVPWLQFGSSGYIKQPNSVVDSFVYRADYDKLNWTSFKMIARTQSLAHSKSGKMDSRQDYILGIHSHKLKSGSNIVSTFEPEDGELHGDEFKYGYNFNETMLNTAKLVINHYRVMSKQYFQEVKAKRTAASGLGYNFKDDGQEYFKNYDFKDVKDEYLKLLYNKS